MFPFDAIRYDEPLFRPPAEAGSAIIQATIGCSWNRCAFCEMYTSKTFRIRKSDELKRDIELLSGCYPGIKKVFLADGNAFVLSASKLMPILDEINKTFGRLQRISSYALPKDILAKTDEELVQIRNTGLRLLYIGIETGDDELLERISKGESFSSTAEGIQKAHKSGIETSVMVINGLGGKTYSRQHALNSAKLVNAVNPKFLSTLTLALPYGQPHFDKRFKGQYIQQTIAELAEELLLFIENTELQGSIFRSDHVSNHLVLKGILSRDKQIIANHIRTILNSHNLDVLPVSPPIL